MRTFQIRNTDSKGYGSYYYLDFENDTDEDEIKRFLENRVNEEITKIEYNIKHQIIPYCFIPIHQQLRKTMKVVEYDKKRHKAVINGTRFKLSLMYIRLTFSNSKSSRYWYEASSYNKKVEESR